MAGALTKAGRYQIVSELGRGSMGVVYQGYDPVIGRTVAVKTILTEGLASQEFLEYKTRFQREAQAAGALTHPNIVTVYDFGEDSGVLYLAMEYLEGKSLEKIVQGQNILPIETIVPMYDQVCAALDHAHSHKIVHRDIKPANIMILDSGLVKITDFGIAKMMSLGMTQAGQILGTPNYMSPEQVKGRAVDGRSDIFSLGVILYELVTGEKPFGGQNITTVIYKIINENPTPPRELDATIPQGLNYVIAKALAKNPDERYQTCRALAEDLKNYKNLGGMTAPSATVLIKVPPLQAPPAEAVAQVPIRPETPPAAVQQAVEQAPVRQVSVQVIPPATSRPQPHGTSALGWVLLGLVILGALGGGGYYFLVWKPEQARLALTSQTTLSTPAVTTTTTTATPTPGGTPAGDTTTSAQTPTTEAPTGTTPDTTATTTTTPPKTKEPPAPKVEPTSTVPLPGGKTTAKVSAPAVPKPGQVVISANVEGAEISIDGGVAGTAPKTLDLLPGTHRVVISKSGYEDYAQSVTIKGGESVPINARLTIPSGEISIITIPAGVEVLVDGKSEGPSPVHLTVSAGEHTFQIKRAGAPPYQSSFIMKANGVIKKTVDLGGGVVAANGVVTVRTVPLGATIVVDSQPREEKTPTSFSLPTGHHVVVVSLTGLPPSRREFDLTTEGVALNINLKQ